MINLKELGQANVISLLEDAIFQEEVALVWSSGDAAASGGAVAEQLEFFAVNPSLSGESPLTDFVLGETAPLAQMQDIADIDLSGLIAIGDEILDKAVPLSDLEIPGFETSGPLSETGPEQTKAAAAFDQMTLNAALTHTTIVIDDDPGSDSVAF